jgi:hypothetical protein
MQGLPTCSDFGYAPASKRAAGQNAVGPAARVIRAFIANA